MDFLRLKKHLLMCRLAANSTALVDKVHPGFSGKISEFRELIVPLLAEENRKILVFSEWTGMLNLVEKELSEVGAKWERLDGSVPQVKRQQLIRSFTDNKDIRIFLSTNAGSTGLNLQAADTVINLDLPWNPAILEQRIGRAHRMGQTSPVQVYLLVTAETIEERLLDLLGAKSALAMATLDLESDVDFIAMSTGVDELKNRLEILLGRRPDKPLEEPVPEVTAGVAGSSSPNQGESHQRISKAGGRLFEAVLSFIDELIPSPPEDQDAAEATDGVDLAASDGAQSPKFPIGKAGKALSEILDNCLTQDENGQTRFSFTLPDNDIIGKITNTLSRLFGK
jgi:hypothetical protein